jgi:hypothetical protein
MEISTARERANDLDLIAGGEPSRCPFGPTNDRTVDGDGEKPGCWIYPLGSKQLRHRRRRDLGCEAIDL